MGHPFVPSENRIFNRNRMSTFLVSGLALLLLSPKSFTQTAGTVTFTNSCAYSLTLLSNGQKIGTLAAKNGKMNKPISSFINAGANVIMAYPNLGAGQFPDCDKWTDLGGAPGTTQREAWMWEGSNTKYAAYCNPNLSGPGICALQRNCSGPGMVQDGTFGTHWEFTPGGGGSNDYVNLSTNAGSGPHSPPNLCPKGGPDDCVVAAANIFYNVPIAWTTNQACSFTGKKTQVKGLRCTSVDCADAYQHPTDDKQAGCPASAARSYTVAYCPSGSSMPNPR